MVTKQILEIFISPQYIINRVHSFSPEFDRSPKLGMCAPSVMWCANIYGYSPAKGFDAVINRLMFEANFFNRVNIYGSGRQSRAFRNVDRGVQELIFLLDGTAPPGICNLVDDNFSILDIAMIAKELMPDLEFSFVDQHMPIGNLTV